MSYRQSINGCLPLKIGNSGLEAARLSYWLSRLTPRFQALKRAAGDDSFPHFRVLNGTGDIERARDAFGALAQGADTILVLGTGGSSLGGQALAQLGGWSIPGDNGPRHAAGPRLRFYDNLDDRSFSLGMRILDLAKTRFIVISKSGTTGETLAQTLTAFQVLDAAGLADLMPRLFLGVTEPHRRGVANGLRNLFEARGIPILDHDTGIGGRYSVFTNVGLLPGLARGLDVKAFRAGAQSVVREMRNAATPEGFAPALGAAVAIGLAKDNGMSASVMMPYSDRLAKFAAWYVQLWAESLGKGGEGTTPLAALGPVDQHSQLQLFMDGPRHHLLNIVRIADAGPGEVPFPLALAEEAGAPYLAGRSIGDLVRAQQNAIVDALCEAKRPVRTFDIDRLDEYTLGALMMHFTLETILAADLLGVDPFDQPAVELGKRLTRQYLAAS